jgi:hypothetical protein
LPSMNRWLITADAELWLAISWQRKDYWYAWSVIPSWNDLSDEDSATDSSLCRTCESETNTKWVISSFLHRQRTTITCAPRTCNSWTWVMLQFLLNHPSTACEWEADDDLKGTL